MTPHHPLAFSTLLAASLLAIQPGATPMAQADPAPSFQFAAIDGGSYDTAKWRGKPVLVVNRGATRADELATLRLDASTSEVLEALVPPAR